jgi:hypothetical protein
MKISFDIIVLASEDSDQENPFDLKISVQRRVQIAEIVRGIEVRAIDMGNLQIIIEFNVIKKYDSVESAQIHSLEYSSELSGLHSYLTMIGEFRYNIYYILNAVLVTVQSSDSGNNALNYYKVTIGRITNSTK